MKKYKVYILAFIAIGIFSAIIYYMLLSKNNIAYVDNVIVYSEFNMTKELDQKATKTRTSRQNILDSMQLNLTKLTKLIENKETRKPELVSYYEKYLKEYYKKRDLFEEDNNSMVSDYNTKIWSQLNQYIKDYGSQKGYDIIYGTSGEGNIMFAKEKYDISKEISEYVNYRYGGGAK